MFKDMGSLLGKELKDLGIDTDWTSGAHQSHCVTPQLDRAEKID